MPSQSSVLTKLNPTTITVPSTAVGKILKLSISPHLSIQTPILDTPPSKVRKDADALFDVIVPVGGRVEVEIEVEGLEQLTADAGQGWYEYEVEEAIRAQLKRSMELNLQAIHVESVESVNNHQLALLPKNATAGRAMVIQGSLGSHSPAAHLERLQLTLAWTVMSNMVQPKFGESQSSHSASQDHTGADDFLSSDDEDDRRALPSGMPAGPLPPWAKEQLHTAMTKLLRAELVKRFPLIFDRELETYLARIALPSAIANSFNRCLQISRSHSTSLLDEVRHRVHTLHSLEKVSAANKHEQVNALISGQRRRASARAQNPKVNDESLLRADLSARSQIAISSSSQLGTDDNPTLAGILAESLGGIGRVHWSRLRSRATGRLSYNRVPVRDHDEDDLSGTIGQPPFSLGSGEASQSGQSATPRSVRYPEFPSTQSSAASDLDWFLSDSDDDELFDHGDNFVDDDLDDDLVFDDGGFAMGDISPVDQSKPHSLPYHGPDSQRRQEGLDDMIDIDDISLPHLSSGEQESLSSKHLERGPDVHPSLPSSTTPHQVITAIDYHQAIDEDMDDDLDSLFSFTSPNDTQTSESLPQSFPTSSWTDQVTSPHGPRIPTDCDMMLLDSDSDDDLCLWNDEKRDHGTSVALPSLCHGTSLEPAWPMNGVHDFEPGSDFIDDLDGDDDLQPLAVQPVHHPLQSDSDEEL